MVRNFMRSLCEHPQYRAAVKWVFIEANMSFIGADEISEECLAFGDRIMVESRDPTTRGRPGVWTGPHEKEAYAWLMRDAIAARTVVFAEQMVGSDLHTHRNALLDQLKNFRMERRDPDDAAFGKSKYTYTSKTSAGDKDDLVLAAQIGHYWGKLKREDETTKEWARALGYRL
jgi:hypothetical protein